MKRALYKGKFQPFHIGHMEIVRTIDLAPDIDEIVIGIGSAQWDWQNRNPEVFWLDNMLTIDERIEIVEASLRGIIAKKFYIVPILDFLPKWGKDSTPKWFEYIRTHSPRFHVLYSNREREIKLFSEAGYEVRPTPLKYDFSATIVREKMALGDTWAPLVCPGAVPLIKSFGAEKRASELFAKVDVKREDYPALFWEWRTFDKISQDDLKRILNLPVFRDEEIRDTYLFSLLRTSVNFKLRRGGFKVKKLMTRCLDGLEAWVSFDADLPMEKEWFSNGCHDIKFPVPKDLPATVTEEILLTKTPSDFNPYAFLFSIEKRRFMRIFQSGGMRCGVDVTIFSLNGREVVTVGLEAEEKSDLEAALEYLGLRKYAPMNYLQFLEKFILKEAGDGIWKAL